MLLFERSSNFWQEIPSPMLEYWRVYNSIGLKENVDETLQDFFGPEDTDGQHRMVGSF